MKKINNPIRFFILGIIVGAFGAMIMTRGNEAKQFAAEGKRLKTEIKYLDSSAREYRKTVAARQNKVDTITVEKINDHYFEIPKIVWLKPDTEFIVGSCEAELEICKQTATYYHSQSQIDSANLVDCEAHAKENGEIAARELKESELHRGSLSDEQEAHHTTRKKLRQTRLGVAAATLFGILATFVTVTR